ncbi:hypothetical protein CR513_40951, partial [Mucuna pruriens]
CMTRSSSNNLHYLDPKIERTLHSFNFVSNSVNNSFATNFEFPDYSNSSFYIKSEPNCSENKAEELEHMENQDQTLKELAMPDVLELAQSYELKSSLIHLLPKFHSLTSEDSYKHLKEFHVVCSTMSKGLAIPIAGSFFHLGRYEAYVSREVLPSVQNYDHPEGDMRDQATLRRNSARISEQLLIQYFYEGLMMMDQSMIDTASGGALMDKTPATTRQLISNMASNKHINKIHQVEFAEYGLR